LIATLARPGEWVIWGYQNIGMFISDGRKGRYNLSMKLRYQIDEPRLSSAVNYLPLALIRLAFCTNIVDLKISMRISVIGRISGRDQVGRY
jgi:hypothetical protein